MPADGVGSARRWYARVPWWRWSRRFRYNRCNWNASAERITTESGLADADGIVGHNATFRVLSACSRTRILTPLSDASPIGWTIRVDDTFRTTIRRRTDHVGLTRTSGLAADDLTLRVGSAGCGDARIDGFLHHRLLRNDGDRLAADERIASEPSGAVTDRVVVDDSALGVFSADTRARIATSLGDTGHVGRTFRVGDAFRSAIRRNSDVTGLTRTGWDSVDVPADAVGSAR